ncbi:MAG: hypothetical protein PHV02_15390 [Rhodocyclaceae bacterium]|nr:hypothetical protein [Rhodocyclaceae bacterium]
MAFFSQKINSRQLAAACCLVSLASCSTPPAQNTEGSETEASSASDTKSTIKSIGADIGCGIASVLNKDCAKGARTGSRVADKVVSWVFRSLKIADAKTVNKEYEDKKAKVSKTDIKPMAFSSKVETSLAAPSPAKPDEEASKGQTGKPASPIASNEVKITSNTDLVGYGDKVPVVTQKYALYDEKNKLLSTQTEHLASVDGAGRYETEARVKIPQTKKGKGAKSYRVETTLVVDGKEYKKKSYKVALLDSGEILLLASEADATNSSTRL